MTSDSRCGHGGVDAADLGADRRGALGPRLPAGLPPHRQRPRRRGPHPGRLHPGLPLAAHLPPRHLRGLAAPHHDQRLPRQDAPQAAHPLRRPLRRVGRPPAEPRDRPGAELRRHALRRRRPARPRLPRPRLPGRRRPLRHRGPVLRGDRRHARHQARHRPLAHPPWPRPAARGPGPPRPRGACSAAASSGSAVAPASSPPPVVPCDRPVRARTAAASTSCPTTCRASSRRSAPSTWDRHLIACVGCQHAVAGERRLQTLLSAGCPSMPGSLHAQLVALASSMTGPGRTARDRASAHHSRWCAPSAPPAHRSPLQVRGPGDGRRRRHGGGGLDPDARRPGCGHAPSVDVGGGPSPTVRPDRRQLGRHDRRAARPGGLHGMDGQHLGSKPRPVRGRIADMTEDSTRDDSTASALAADAGAHRPSSTSTAPRSSARPPARPRCCRRRSPRPPRGGRAARTAAAQQARPEQGGTRHTTRMPRPARSVCRRPASQRTSDGAVVRAGSVSSSSPVSPPCSRVSAAVSSAAGSAPRTASTASTCGGDAPAARRRSPAPARPPGPRAASPTSPPTPRPSVVTIRVEAAGGDGTGSGWVLDDKGHIVTNNHVIAAAAERRRDHRRALQRQAVQGHDRRPRRVLRPRRPQGRAHRPRAAAPSATRPRSSWATRSSPSARRSASSRPSPPASSRRSTAR